MTFCINWIFKYFSPFAAHLPPSGSIHSRSPSANGRIHMTPPNKPVVNQAFLNDLHQAMSQKRQPPQPGFPNNMSPSELQSEGTTSADRPFPNRFSSGEYENVQQPKLVHDPFRNNCGQATQPPPPLPKRNDETHLTWDRT